MKNIFLVMAFFMSINIFAQVGIGTQNTQGIFNIDGAKDNATSGAPTTAQQANDFVVLPNGNVGIGTTAPSTILDIASTTGSITNTRYTATSALGANLILQKSSISTNLTNQAVPSGDIIGRIVWKSNQGAGFNPASGAEIRAEQVGLATISNNGSRLIFSTTAENSTSFSDRMTITDAGNVGIGTTTPKTALDVRNGSGVGAIGLGSTAATATAAGAGALRYNSADASIGFSDGTNWQKLTTQVADTRYRTLDRSIGGFVNSSIAITSTSVNVYTQLPGSSVTVTIPSGYSTVTTLIRFDTWGDVNSSTTTTAQGSLRFGIIQTGTATATVNSVMMSGWSLVSNSNQRFSAPVSYAITGLAPGTYTFVLGVNRETESIASGSIAAVRIWGVQSSVEVLGKN